MREYESSWQQIFHGQMKNLKRGLISNEYPSLVTLSPIKELKVKCKNSTDFFAGASVSEDMCFT